MGCHWLSLGAPVLAEMAADAGAQTIVIDMQHGRWDREGLENAIAAIRGRAPPLVRTADASDFAIGQALDAGAHGVIVPMVNSAAEAAQVVAAAHYPPLGRRSGGGVRPMTGFRAYRESMDRHMVAAVMIETLGALEAVEAIAATERLGMVFVGPHDLSLALGAAPDSAEFEAALQRVLAACKNAGTRAGIYTATPAQASARAAQGFRFVVAASDQHLNGAEARSVWARFRAIGAA